MKTAWDFWNEMYDEVPQNDGDRLAVAMMEQYAAYVQSQSSSPPPEASEDRWIPVSERLPENKKMWLCSVSTDDGYEIHSLYLDGKNNWIHDGEPTFCKATYFEVTHWKSLPNPPQIKQEQGNKLKEK